MAEKLHGPGQIWVQIDDLVTECMLDVGVSETDRGWVITDLCISLAPPEAVRSLIKQDELGPRLSDFASYPVDDEDPPRGITSRHIQQIRLEDIRAAIVDAVGSWSDDWQGRIPALTAAMNDARHTRRDDLFYATVAAVYVDVTQHTKRGIYKEMAGLLPYAESSLIDAVKEARTRELLTRPLGGRSGGQLTLKAVSLLERNGR